MHCYPLDTRYAPLGFRARRNTRNEEHTIWPRLRGAFGQLPTDMLATSSDRGSLRPTAVQPRPRHGRHSNLVNKTHAKERTRHRLYWVLAIAVPATVILVVGMFAAGCWFRINRLSLHFPGSPRGGTTYLLVGSDSRSFVDSASERARFGSTTSSPGQHGDVILLVRVATGGHVSVMPIPRDLLVALPDGAPTRITMTLLQGPQTMIDTMCDSLGIGVNHLVLIRMNGLESIVDAVGGVEVRSSFPERDLVTGLSISHSGWSHLDGSQALAYVRSRHLEYFENGTWRTASTAADERSGRAAVILRQLGNRMDLRIFAPVSSVERLWTLSGALTVDRGASPFDLDQLAHALEQSSRAPQVDLPVTLHPGPVPTADLDPGGRVASIQFNGGTTPGCSFRAPVASSYS
jgi:LCP family protein required for cell wall assembly